MFFQFCILIWPTYYSIWNVLTIKQIAIQQHLKLNKFKRKTTSYNVETTEKVSLYFNILFYVISIRKSNQEIEKYKNNNNVNYKNSFS